MPDDSSLDSPAIARRDLLAYAGVLGSAFLAAQGYAADDTAKKPDPKAAPLAAGKQYPFKKSINLWAFPYPQQMTLTQCFELAAAAGFDGVEVNYNPDGDISPDASEADLRKIGKLANELGLQISGVCSFLFWPYSLTSNDKDRRTKGLDYAKRMTAAAQALGTKNVLVVPGAVYIPWGPEPEPVANQVCWDRATAAIKTLEPLAKQAGVLLNMENIFANGFLMSPAEMNRFVDQFDRSVVGIHFDTGNIAQFQFPEHWIAECGPRIRNVHLKEYSKKAGTEFTLESFRPLLDGTTNWPAVLEAFAAIKYDGYLTFEYFHPYPHWPEALIYQTSDSLDRMLGRR